MKHITVAAKHPVRTIRWQSICDDEAAISKWANPQSAAKHLPRGDQSDNGGKSSGRAEATTKHPSVAAKFTLQKKCLQLRMKTERKYPEPNRIVFYILSD
jgi:hypothetical protein